MSVKTKVAKLERALSPVTDPPTDEDLQPMVQFMRGLNEIYDVQQSDAEIIQELRSDFAKMGASGAAVREINRKSEAGLAKIYGPGGPGYDDDSGR